MEAEVPAGLLLASLLRSQSRYSSGLLPRIAAIRWSCWSGSRSVAPPENVADGTARDPDAQAGGAGLPRSLGGTEPARRPRFAEPRSERVGSQDALRDRIQSREAVRRRRSPRPRRRTDNTPRPTRTRQAQLAVLDSHLQPQHPRGATPRGCRSRHAAFSRPRFEQGNFGAASRKIFTPY